jgi:hypothetical protein
VEQEQLGLFLLLLISVFSLAAERLSPYRYERGGILVSRGRSSGVCTTTKEENEIKATESNYFILLVKFVNIVVQHTHTPRACFVSVCVSC